jgi:hypothetical protein
VNPITIRGRLGDLETKEGSKEKGKDLVFILF